MTEEQIKALLNLIDQCKKEEHTGNIQLNYFKGTCGTVQVLKSFKMEALVDKFLVKI